MKKFTLALMFSFFLAGAGFSQSDVSLKGARSAANRTLLSRLLELPSPPENRSATIANWRKAENERMAEKTNIVPADDAPIADIIRYWTGKRIYEVPKPSVKLQERLLEAVQKDVSLISPLISFLPTHKEAVEIITRAASEIEENNKTSLDYDLQKWLLIHSPDKRGDLISILEKIQANPNDRDDFGAVEYDEHLVALSKTDWETAYPIINACWGSKHQRLSTLGLTLLYERAVRENSTDAENFREQLKQIVADKNAKGYARNLAVEYLMKTEWPGRDEWFIALFSDESLNDITDNSFGYEPLTSVVGENPDYWIPKVARLLGDKNKTVHLAAVSCLAEFEDYRAREDATKALLPYLDDTDDWKYTDSGNAIYSLNFIYLPESIPVLKKIVQKEEGFTREYAAMALGMKYKVADAAPVLEKALMAEPEKTYQEGIVQGLVHCGGLSDEKKIGALEFYLQNPPDDSEYSDQQEPLAGLGMYLSKFEATNEEFTRTLLAYSDKIEKKKPELSGKIKALVYSWNNAEANRALIKAIEVEAATAEDILAAIQKREAIKKDFYQTIEFWIENGGQKAGIAAVILEDAETISKITGGRDSAAQTFLFATARLTERFIGGSYLIRGTGVEVPLKLPLEKVNKLFKKNDAYLSAAIEKYLEAEDSETARKLILTQYKGKARIVGRRLPAQFGGSFEELDKTEENLRREILTDKDLEEIFAYHSTIIRIRRGKAEVTTTVYNWETKKSSENKYFLSAANLKKLRDGFEKTNPFALKPVSIPSNSCFTQPLASEFLYLTKNGGVRVYMAGPPFEGFGQEEYQILTSFWNSL